MDTLNPFDPGYSEPTSHSEPDLDVFGLEPIARAEPKPAPKSGRKGVVIHRDVEQGSLQWFELRRGILTSSEMKLIITPTLKVADNDKVRTHLYELLAQRVTGHVEPHFQTYDMERGHFDEEHARAKYSETYAEVEEVGFVTNDKLGFNIGCSPDGLVGDDGQLEIKSRLQKWQMQTMIECVSIGEIPADYLIQVQSSTFVTERKWLDFISYSGGMKMATVRCYPDQKIHEAIGNAALTFEVRLAEKREVYEKLIASDARLVATERLIYL